MHVGGHFHLTAWKLFPFSVTRFAIKVIYQREIDCNYKSFSYLEINFFTHSQQLYLATGETDEAASTSTQAGSLSLAEPVACAGSSGPLLCSDAILRDGSTSQQQQQEQLCVVCHYFPLSRALLPCRHTCICAVCFCKYIWKSFFRLLWSLDIKLSFQPFNFKFPIISNVKASKPLKILGKMLSLTVRIIQFHLKNLTKIYQKQNFIVGETQHFLVCSNKRLANKFWMGFNSNWNNRQDKRQVNAKFQHHVSIY